MGGSEEVTVDGRALGGNLKGDIEGRSGGGSGGKAEEGEGELRELHCELIIKREVIENTRRGVYRSFYGETEDDELFLAAESGPERV